VRTHPPPLCAPYQVDRALSEHGHAAVDRAGLEALCHGPLPLERWAPAWDALAPDRYLRDGGRYRTRRHGCFVIEPDRSVTLAPHRAHWQPLAYNALHGGIERWFEPLPVLLTDDPAWTALLASLGDRASALRGPRRWFVEAHMFRIDTRDGIGRPTPEGAHRDGVDLVAVTLIARERVRGGETRVFDADGPHGIRFTMQSPGTTLLLDDARVIHETTPIQPLEPAESESESTSSAPRAGGWRDTLVITVRADGFQGPSFKTDGGGQPIER
jgi:hypothetical protein